MKSLVIYFSHTGENYMAHGIENIEKGNTEIFAEYIKDITKADLFKVDPKEKYPYNYYECCDVAKKEFNENKRPVIKNTLENINDYDVIYIGGPIWWGTYPMAIFTCIETLDFKGKIVMPFSTHEGSGLGNVMSDLPKYCKDADIRKGLAIRGCKVKDNKKEIEGWCIK
jgi:flavodoxin